MSRQADYSCPDCDGQLRPAGQDGADWECENCHAIIREVAGRLLVDREPDRHGSAIHVYERNHAADGQHHE